MNVPSTIISPTSAVESAEARVAGYDWKALAEELSGYGAAMIEKLLEFGCRLRALFGLEMGDTAQVGRHATRDVTELIGLSGAQLLDSLGTIAMLQLDPSVNLRDCQLLDKRIQRIVLAKFRGGGLRLRRFAASGEHKSNEDVRDLGFSG